jgi:ribonuclease HI
MRTSKDKALNPDLWSRLLKLCEEREVEFRWVRGHNGHSQNERCDCLANVAAKKSNLPPDMGYEGHSARLF